MERQIRNAVEAIKAGVLKETLYEEVGKLESQKSELQKEISHMEGRKSLEKDLETMVDELLGYANNFDELWNQCATNEEKKAFIRAFLYQITLDHSPEHIKATYYLYNLPQLPENGLAVNTLSSAHGEFALSPLRGPMSYPTGRPHPRLIPWLSAQEFDFKKPYAHYRGSFAAAK